ncbi:MAG: PAS domain-containing protein [Saprospiraceae bacterium]|jgi:PAS domain-containing protein
MFIQIFIAMSIWVVFFIRKRLPYWFRASLVIFALYFVSLAGLLQFGLLAAAGAWLIIIPALSVILFNIRTGLAMTLIIFLSFVVITTSNVKGFIVFDYNVSEYAASLSSWVNFSMTYLLGSVLVFIAISISTNSLMNTVSETDDIAKDLARLIETANNPIFEVDTEGKVNEWNQASEKIMGFTKDEVLGKDLVQTFIAEDYRASVKKVLDNTSFFKKVAIWGICIGLPISIIRTCITYFSSHDEFWSLMKTLSYAFGTVPLAIAYVASLGLLYKKRITLLKLFAPVGKIALTNYLLQTLLATTLFYGIGFGFVGKFGYTLTIGIAVIEFTVVTVRVVLNLTHSLPNFTQVLLSMGIIFVIRKTIQTEDLKPKSQNDCLLIHCLRSIYIITLVFHVMENWN